MTKSYLLMPAGRNVADTVDFRNEGEKFQKFFAGRVSVNPPHGARAGMPAAARVSYTLCIFKEGRPAAAF